MTAARGLALATALIATGLLSACDSLPDWLGEREGPPLPGERISVLSLEEALAPDPGIADLQVVLPKPWQNVDWPQASGRADGVMQHLALGDAPRLAWTASIGEGSDDETRLLARPVVGGGRVFALDANSYVTALNAGTGQRLWRYSLRPKGEEVGALGGGLAYSDGVVFVATGYGWLYALDAETGALFWSYAVGVPIRSAPAVADGRVYVIGYDNQMHALTGAEGRVLWKHTGIPEDAGLIGGAAPAVNGGIVIAPYSSGELFALRVENGRRLWSDQLVRAARLSPLSVLSDISGSPVIDGDRVIAISHSGRIAAIELRSGQRIWDRDIGGTETPWVAGEFLFLLTIQAELVCLSRRDGRIRWVRQLQRFENEADREDPVQWVGPVLASDRLIVASSHGEALTVSPYDGRILGRLELPDGVQIAPVIADATLYILTEDADLLALR